MAANALLRTGFSSMAENFLSRPPYRQPCHDQAPGEVRDPALKGYFPLGGKSADGLKPRFGREMLGT